MLTLFLSCAVIDVQHAQAQSGEPVSVVRSTRTELWIDAAGARITQRQQPRQRAAVVGVGAQRTGRFVSIAAQLSATSARDSAGAGQGDLAAQLLLPVWPRLRTDILLSATSFGLPATGRDDSRSATVREAIDWRAGRASAGVFAVLTKAGAARNDEGRRVHFGAIAAGGGVRAGLYTRAVAFEVNTEWQRALSNDYLLAEATGYGLSRFAASYDYRDVTSTAVLRLPRTDITVSHARRHGGSATTGASQGTWGSLSIQATRRVAIVGSTGTRVADVLRGVPEAAVTSAGVRVQFGWRSSARSFDRSRVAGTAARSVVVVPDSSGAVVTIRIAAKPNDVLQFATSHGEWTPVRMQRDGDFFTARIRLPSGTHRIAVRVNDGPWFAPAGTVRVRDDFGGTAGVVVVP